MMTIISLVMAFGILAAAFGVIERRPASAPRAWRDPSVRTDVAFWFFTPLVGRTVSAFALGAVLLALAGLAGLHVSRSGVDALLTAHGPVSRQPRWVQAGLALLLLDLLGYWMHRLFHGGRLWPFHAVHHGSEHLDWLSSVRVHPVNEVVMRLAQVLPLVLLGFDPRLLTAIAPVFTIYALFLHANVSWSFGPLKYAIASPAFHRWHHAADAEARDKNFAGLFPVWDVLFGTFYVPANAPGRFGLVEARVPRSMWAQLTFPFRRTSVPASDSG